MKEEVRGHFLGQENILSDIGNREKQEQKEWEDYQISIISGSTDSVS